MCYKVENFLSKAQVAKALKVSSEKTIELPIQAMVNAFDHPNLYVVRQSNPNVLGVSRWGLIPSWATPENAPDIWNKTLNARLETIDEKPSFRNSIDNNRIIIAVGGFYEYRTEGKEKKLHYIYNPHFQSPILFAGLESVWENQEKGKRFSTCSIVTTAANSRMEYIHNVKQRMPLILNEMQTSLWLSNEKFEHLNWKGLIPDESMHSDIYIQHPSQLSQVQNREDLLQLKSNTLL